MDMQGRLERRHELPRHIRHQATKLVLDGASEGETNP